MAQEAGRGRQGREWVSATGNFFGSTIVAVTDGGLAPQSLSRAAGLALIEAVDVAVPDQPLMLKWPNDLMLGVAKLAGILLERSGNRIVVGFGVNLASAPKLADRDTASLNGILLPQAFAPLLAGSFARMLALWRSSDAEAFARAWLARAHPVGTRLTVHSSAEERIIGTFDGIEPDGALRLRRNGDVDVIRAGDVEL
jgi:BirA family transcriptional regulator, biotin operon repressor / biotin---[acetyl-CoA-carboxylase] ligase